MSQQQPMVQLVQLAQGPVLTTVATAATASALQQQQQQQQLIHHQQPSMLSYPFNGQFIINQATGQPQLIAYSPLTGSVDSTQAIQVIPSPNAGHMLVSSDQQQQQQQQPTLFHQQQQMQILQFTDGAKFSSPQFVQFNPVATPVATQVIFNPATGQIIGQLASSPVANITPFQVINTLTHATPSSGPAATAIAIQSTGGNILPQSTQTTILQSSPQQQQQLHQQQQHLPSQLITSRTPVAVVSSALTTVFPTCSSTSSSLSTSSSSTSSSLSTSPAFSTVITQSSSPVSSVKNTHHNNKISTTTTVTSIEAHVQQIIQQEKQKLLQLKDFYKGQNVTSNKVPINPIVRVNNDNDKQICVVKSISPTIDSRSSPCNSLKDDAISCEKWPDDSCNIETGDHENSNDESIDSETSSYRTSLEGETSASGETGTQSTIRQIQSSAIGTEIPRIVDGVNLQEVKEFANLFKTKRLNFGLTQTQVGLALAQSQGPTYSQSAICRFEKLEITPKSALKIMPVLKEWMAEAEKRYNKGDLSLTDVTGSESSKKRKRRTSFSPGALEILNNFFTNISTHPIPAQMTELADKLNYDREVIRVWFCNKRQALKNTVRRIENNNHINSSSGECVNNLNHNNNNNNNNMNGNNNNGTVFQVKLNGINETINTSSSYNNNETQILIK